MTIDSEDLFQLFQDFAAERRSLETSVDEHRIQGEIYRQRIGCDIYRSIAEEFAQLYSLLRYSSSYLIISFPWFKKILLQNFTKRNALNDNSSNSRERLESLNEILRRETYLRCFQSISSYLSSAFNRMEYQIFFLFFAFFKEKSLNNLRLFQLIIEKFHPSKSILIPDYLDDPRRPSFISKYSWTLISNEEFQEKFPNLSDHFIENQSEWKEYLSPNNSIDYLNPSPYERTTDLHFNLIDRFLLFFLLQPDRVCLSSLSSSYEHSFSLD